MKIELDQSKEERNKGNKVLLIIFGVMLLFLMAALGTYISDYDRANDNKVERIIDILVE